MTDEDRQKLLNLGEKLKFFRLEKGYSQEKFAELSSLDRTYVSGLERGKRNPSYLILMRIVSILEISIDKLFS
jgi:transcriptional regulator with XRE-family HTH domain